MARPTNNEKKTAQKVAALLLLYEFGVSTRHLLRHHISHDNFQQLTKEKLIQALSKMLHLGGEERRRRVTVYEITAAGRQWLKRHSGADADLYRLRDDLIPHQLAAQAYIQREGWQLLAATSSIAKIVAHRRHKKNIHWQKWQYDALCESEDCLIALEIERTPKKGIKKDVMLSKLAEFLDGYRTDGKLHRVVIACETPALVETWEEAIRKGFDKYHYQTGTQEPVRTGFPGIIKKPDLIDVVLFPLAAVRAIALPPEQRAATESGYGQVQVSRSRVRASRLVDDVMAAAQAGEAALAAKITELQAASEQRAVERLTGDLQAKIKAEYHDRLIARNRAIKQAQDEALEAKAAQEAAEAEVEQHQKQIRQLQRKLQEAADLFYALRSASVGNQEYYDAFDDLHYHFQKQ